MTTAYRQYSTITETARRMRLGCAVIGALALWSGLAWGMERAQARSLASIVTVTSTADSGAGSLRAALGAAVAGDTIQFSLPANSIIVLSSGELRVTKTVTLDGSTATNLAVSGNGASRVFSVSVPLSIRALTIRNGSGSGNGGGINTTADLTLTSVSLLTNTATGSGGAVYISGGDLVLTGTQLLSNTALAGAGVWQQGGNTSATNGRLERGSASNAGGLLTNGALNLTNTNVLSNKTTGSFMAGALLVSGAVRIAGGVFQNNSGGTLGGGALRTDGAVTLIGAVFQDNSTPGLGGAIRTFSSLNLSGTQVLDNSGNTGGGIYVLGSAIVNGGLFQNNSATSQGAGGLYVQGTVDMTGTQFYSNSAVSMGGGLFAVNTLTMTGTKFVANTSGSLGGGVLHSLGNAVLTNVYFERNDGASGGGALVSLGVLTLNNATVLSNTSAGAGAVWANDAATVTGGLFQGNVSGFGAGFTGYGALTITGTQFLSNTGTGGGVYATGPATITNVLFQNNSTSTSGGGVYATGPTTITNVLFQNNSTSTSGGGVYATGPTTLSNVQFQNNSASTSGGGVYSDGTLTLQNTRFSGNSAASGGAVDAEDLILAQVVTTTEDFDVRGDWAQNATLWHDGIVVTLRGSSAQVITGTSPISFTYLSIANTGAGVTLGKSITVSNRFTIGSDLSTTSAYILNLGAGAVVTGGAEVWGRTARTHPFVLNTTYTFGNPNIFVKFTSGTPPTQMIFDLRPSSPVNPSFSNAISRTYQITQVGASNFTATLRLRYDNSEMISGTVEADLQLWRYQSGWAQIGATGVDTVTNWVESSAVRAFSPWAISEDPPEGPSAVTLVRLDATSADPGAAWGLLLAGIGLGLLAAVYLMRRRPSASPPARAAAPQSD